MPLPQDVFTSAPQVTTPYLNKTIQGKSVTTSGAFTVNHSVQAGAIPGKKYVTIMADLPQDFSTIAMNLVFTKAQLPILSIPVGVNPFPGGNISNVAGDTGLMFIDLLEGSATAVYRDVNLPVIRFLTKTAGGTTVVRDMQCYEISFDFDTVQLNAQVFDDVAGVIEIILGVAVLSL
jgi:hypothetical protein